MLSSCWRGGSGKSVTALSLTGLVASPPAVITSGKILFEGTDLLSLKFEQMREYRGKRIAYVFQDQIPAFILCTISVTSSLSALKYMMAV